MAGKKAFVTGGTGFVGSHLVEQLISSGYDEIRCLARGDARWLDGLDATIVRGGLQDTEALDRGMDGVDYVYHVAGVTRTPDPAVYQRANVEGTVNIVEAVKRAGPSIRNTLVTSSLAVVGDVDVRIADESTRLNPVSLYGKSKAAMEERLVEAAGSVSLVVVRPPAVYGPRDKDILVFFQTLARGLFPVVGSPTKPSVSLVHARDLARGMISAAESGRTSGETYFLGSPRQYSWTEVRDEALRALGRRALTIRIPTWLAWPVGALSEIGGKLTGTYPALNREKAVEIVRACTMCTSEKAFRDFGYSPEMSLATGVTETIEWYRQSGWIGA